MTKRRTGELRRKAVASLKRKLQEKLTKQHFWSWELDAKEWGVGWELGDLGSVSSSVIIIP